MENQHRVLYSKILVDGTILLLTTDSITLTKVDCDTESINGDIPNGSDFLDVEIQVRIVKENRLIGESTFCFHLNKETFALSDKVDVIVTDDKNIKKSELQENIDEIQRIFTLCEHVHSLQYYVDDLDIYFY